jgi:N-methylhydantoinase A
MPGNFAAWGMLCTDLKHDYVQTFVAAVGTADLERIHAIYEQLEAIARATLSKERIRPEQTLLVRTADVRYLGQGHALPVPLPGGRLDEQTREAITRQFDGLHLATYLHNAPEEPKEIVALRLSAIGEVADPRLPTIDGGERKPPDRSRQGERQVFYKGECKSWEIFDRSHLLAGNKITGPAVIEESVSTALVLPNQIATVDTYGNLILTWDRTAS